MNNEKEGGASPIESGPERIFTKEEVLMVISRYAESTEVMRELSDERGLYLLEAQAEIEEGDESGETEQYCYMRKGRFPNNNQSSDTSIHLIYYREGVPIGGKCIATYKPETESWEDGE